MKSEINKILEDHELRIKELEKRLFTKEIKPTDLQSGELSLTDHLLNLKKKGFFKQPKTADEAQKNLKDSYDCAIDRVAMALLRLSKKKELRVTTKTIAEREYKAYVW